MITTFFLHLLIVLFMNTNETKSELSATLLQTIERAKKDQSKIGRDRKLSLDQLVDAIKQQRKEKGEAKVIYICTHNSRRSQMAELLSTAIGVYLSVEGYSSYSGGTEVTAFNERAVAALGRAGFEIEAVTADQNPKYEWCFADGAVKKTCFSKQYEDPFNPQKEFIAAIVCSSADESCPIVHGADARVSIPYLDPKEYDDTDLEAEKYDERLRQIAAEMYYVMSKLV
jgi:protein-tyrosine-phosphatase